MINNTTASDTQAATPRQKAVTRIEHKVRRKIRKFLGNLEGGTEHEEEGVIYKHYWNIPPELEEKMVAYDIETYDMNLAEIAEHFGEDPFEDLLDYIKTDSKFKVRDWDLFESIEPGLHFNLWFHLVKDINKLKEGVDYKYRELSSEFTLTVNAAIRIAMDGESVAGAIVSEVCYKHAPGPTNRDSSVYP